MTTFALASEYHRLTSEQRDRVTHIIADDGEWTPAQISAYINRWAYTFPDPLPEPTPDDWAKPEPLT